MSWNIPVLQHVEPAKSAAEASEYVEAMRAQQGSLGARVIGDGVTKAFAAQGFFEDEPEATWFPDGTRRVFISQAFLDRLEAK